MLKIYMDLDDTLIQTQQLFKKFKQSCTNFVLIHDHTDTLEYKEVLDYFNEREIVNIDIYGFKNERFIISWQETLMHFHPDRHPDEIGRLAGLVFERTAPIMDGAIETLEALTREGYDITIITCGVDDVQNKRIDDVGIRHYFKDIHVVPYKNKEMMGSIITDLENSVMIGNSMRSDINPSLQLGIPAIQVEANNWFHDEMDIIPQGEYYHCNISEVPTVVAGIEDRKATTVNI